MEIDPVALKVWLYMLRRVKSNIINRLRWGGCTIQMLFLYQLLFAIPIQSCLWYVPFLFYRKPSEFFGIMCGVGCTTYSSKFDK